MIKTAAIRQDGKIFTGKDHILIRSRVMDITHKADGEEGFITTDGKFVGLEDAALVAFSAGQIKKLKKRLHMRDLK